MRTLLLLASLITLAACGSDGMPDSGVDAGTDAGALDAGPFLPPAALPVETEPPDPFVTWEDGTPVVTAQEWNEVRAPELRTLFRHYVYGFEPPAAAVTAAERTRDDAFLDGRAVYEEVLLRFGPEDAPPISLAVIRPSGVTDPPVFLILNKCGNHTVTDAPSVLVSEGWVDSSICTGERGSRAALYDLDAILARGYALATFHESDIDPDDPSDRRHQDGVHPHFPVDAAPDVAWGRIAAWAWGLSRAVDYLQNAEGIDGTRIATVGHSRRGKAALLAGALDPRIAMAIPHQSGTVGASLSRNMEGESIESITTVFPLWFNRVFPDFSDRVTQLPVDQHLLIALMAPRPVLVGNGEEDLWADPDGALQAVQLAGPVYDRLAGAPVFETDAAGIPTAASPLGWVTRPGGHSLESQDWALFLDFADRHLAASD